MTADLYCRVSTDEQADKGYSLRDQDEKLRRYCEQHAIMVRRVITEDYSAKSFNRPEWKKLLTEYKKKGRSSPALILFTKWDRFSRKTADAYNMIALLNDYGIEPRAIEQPLDLSVPESKVILAIYLAAPEVENDRRSLNVISGMRRARKEGIYMGVAPFGYRNKIDEIRGKHIGIYAKEAVLVRWIFEELAKDRYNSEQIFKMAQNRGFPKSKAQFWRLIQNPVYCGKIFIHAFKNEAASVVPALHTPIITEALYNEVQRVLRERARKPHAPKPKVVSHSMLPLRGFLICPSCGRTLTGSASLGRNKSYSYHYYHCRNKCQVRYKAFDLNAAFEDHLAKMKLKSWAMPLFQKAIVQTYKAETRAVRQIQGQMVIDVKDLNEKIGKARNLFISGELEPEDFKMFKADNEHKIKLLEEQLSTYRHSKYNLDNFLSQVMENLCHISYLYKYGSAEQKRKIVCFIYPEKFIFDGTTRPKAKVSKPLEILYHFA